MYIILYSMLSTEIPYLLVKLSYLILCIDFKDEMLQIWLVE